MRILNDDKEESIRNVIILLTADEAKEVRSSIDELLSRNLRGDHSHINDQEYKHEITLALYEPGADISQFEKRVQELILEDK